MKLTHKRILYIDLIAVILGFVFLAWSYQQRQYTVNGTSQDWQVVLSVIDKSNAPHQDVKAVTGFILSQLEKQDQAYRKQDSLRVNAQVQKDSLNRKP